MLYLTFPVTTATVERSFSSLRCVKTYLRSTMTSCRLNILFLLYIHQDRTRPTCVSTLLHCAGDSRILGLSHACTHASVNLTHNSQNPLGHTLEDVAGCVVDYKLHRQPRRRCALDTACSWTIINDHVEAEETRRRRQ